MKRNKSMDIAKAIGIILVVIGHSDSPLRSFVYLFHMPLFFFISGYFYKDEYSDKPFKLIFKRLKSLYIPFVAYQMIFILLHNFFYKINIYSNNKFYGKLGINPINGNDAIQSLKHVLYFERSEQLAGVFWFFTTLFIINVMFCLISFIIKRIVKGTMAQEFCRAIVVLISFGVGDMCAVKNIHTPKKMEVAFVVLLFFYVGYLYRKYESAIKIKLPVCILCLIALICTSFYATLSISTNENINPLFLLTTSFMGIYFMMCISKYIASINSEFKILKYIGGNTVAILCLHFLSFKIVNLIQVVIYKYPSYRLAAYPTLSGANGWWILYVLVGVFAPLLFQKAIIDNLKNIFKLSNHKKINKIQV